MSAQLTEETWVNTIEGAELTGYHEDHIRELARNNYRLPEDKRLIKVRKRSNRYDIWLPDLINYIKTYGRNRDSRLKSSS